MPLEIANVHFDCASSLNLGVRGGCFLTTALSLWRHVHFRTWWSLFVAGAREPRASVVQSRLFVTGTALCEPRSADFVAGAALCEPHSADVVAGTALCAPQSADFVAGVGQEGAIPKHAVCEPRRGLSQAQATSPL